MDLHEINEIKKFLKREFQENFLEETMNIKGELEKIITDFYKMENTKKLSKDELIQRKNEAINNLDIENLKKIDEELNNFDDLE